MKKVFSQKLHQYSLRYDEYETEKIEKGGDYLNHIMKEFVLTRMEALESKLQKNEDYWQQVQISCMAGKKFETAVKRGEGIWEAYIDYEEEKSKANCLYSEAAYMQGFEDGILIGVEKQPDGRKSVLSLEDMTAMISVYDAVQKLKETMLGGKTEYCEEGGVLTVFKNVYDIVEHAACEEIRLLGDDEAAERVTEILDKNVAAENRAKELLGLE